jgi:hypothetical protein
VRRWPLAPTAGPTREGALGWVHDNAMGDAWQLRPAWGVRFRGLCGGPGDRAQLPLGASPVPPPPAVRTARRLVVTSMMA